MKPSTFVLAVEPDGTIVSIYNDALVELIDQGTAQISRASHVEPAPSGNWLADMSPVIRQYGLECDNPILGPFRLREDALKAEVEFLEQKLF